MVHPGEEEEERGEVAAKGEVGVMPQPHVGEAKEGVLLLEEEVLAGEQEEQVLAGEQEELLVHVDHQVAEGDLEEEIIHPGVLLVEGQLEGQVQCAVWQMEEAEVLQTVERPRGWIKQEVMLKQEMLETAATSLLSKLRTHHKLLMRQRLQTWIITKVILC